MCSIDRYDENDLLCTLVAFKLPTLGQGAHVFPNGAPWFPIPWTDEHLDECGQFGGTITGL